jgi:hypothetical protein
MITRPMGSYQFLVDTLMRSFLVVKELRYVLLYFLEIQLHKDNIEAKEEREWKHNAAHEKGQKLSKDSGPLPNAIKKVNSSNLDTAILEFLVSCRSAPNIK